MFELLVVAGVAMAALFFVSERVIPLLVEDGDK